MNNKYILILSGFMLFGSSCEEPKQQESVEINFNTESEQYRNVKTKNLSPYSLFGDSSIVLMTEEEYKNEHITEVLNSNEDAEIAKLVFENNTGFVNIYNKQGKLIDRLLMDDKVLAKFISVDPLAEKAPDWTPYRYGFNNPINYIDPDGRWEVRI
ncbi:MAG: superfamily I DNA and/or RNA helicase, partial [Arenicella sp.]